MADVVEVHNEGIIAVGVGADCCGGGSAGLPYRSGDCTSPPCTTTSRHSGQVGGLMLLCIMSCHISSQVGNVI